MKRKLDGKRRVGARSDIPEFDVLRDELHAYGAKFDAVDVCHGKNGRGMFAESMIPAGTTLISIPRTIVISVAKARTSTMGRRMQMLVGDRSISDRTMLQAYLIHLRDAPVNPSEPLDAVWRTYLRHTPPTYSNPMVWSQVAQAQSGTEAEWGCEVHSALKALRLLEETVPGTVTHVLSLAEAERCDFDTFANEWTNYPEMFGGNMKWSTWIWVNKAVLFECK